MNTSFENLILGPAISIPSLDQKQQTLKDILDRDLIVVAYVTDVNHPVFEAFEHVKDKESKPVAVFVTVYYKYYYE